MTHSMECTCRINAGIVVSTCQENMEVDWEGLVTFHPVIDKQSMVHSEGPALTHLDLNMTTAPCTVGVFSC